MTDRELQVAMLTAIDAHDLDRIQRLTDSKHAMHLLHRQVLPWAETADVRWFWESIQADQFSLLCHKIRDVCSDILMNKGYQPGDHFSWASEDDLPALWVDPSAHACLIKALPPERYSTARIILRGASAN